MKPMISTLSALAAIVVFATPYASALSCAQQAADLQNRQVKAQEIADARLTLVEDVEAAGDAWENAEAMRNFGAEEAAEADTTKVTYETLKADLMATEKTLQSSVLSLNQEVAAYNAKCVRN